MARAAGVEMTESRLLAENGRRHFLTRRFDRLTGDKLHVQTLGALDHISYKMPGAYGYDQTMLLMRRIGIKLPQIEQLFRRMVFNVVARNQDDHVKNIAFLMDRAGRWSLAPAYDVTWACEPTNRWLQTHQMTINGKRERITVEDLVTVEKRIGLKRGTAKRTLREVTDAVAGWAEIAEEVTVEPAMATDIERSLQLMLPPR
jgi:serine/threonine-protein kinase HipA